MVSQDDINFLPPDLRGKEEKIRKRAPQKAWEVKMTSPPRKPPKLKEASKTSWWEEMKKFLTQPLGKKDQPMPLGSLASIKTPVFEYEKKVPSKPAEKPKLIEIKTLPPKAEPAKKVSFWSRVFKTKKHELKIEARMISTRDLPSQKKEIPPSVKKEAVKEITAWSKITEPEKIQPKPIPKVSFWSEILKPKAKISQVKSTPKFTPSLSPSPPAKISFFEKIFGPKRETALKIEKKAPISSKPAKKEKAPLKFKKFKSPSISFIPENEVSVKLKFFKKIFLGEVVILLFCFLLGFSYLMLLWYHANLMTKSSDLEIKISELKEKIAQNKKEEETMLIDQKRIKAAQALLDQHIYWSNLFDLLERYTVDNVYYKDFIVSDFEKITLQAVGTDFRSMARQLLVFSQAKDYIKDVKISGGNYSPAAGVSFTINLTVDKALFYKLSHADNSLE